MYACFVPRAGKVNRSYEPRDETRNCPLFDSIPDSASEVLFKCIEHPSANMTIAFPLQLQTPSVNVSSERGHLIDYNLSWSLRPDCRGNRNRYPWAATGCSSRTHRCQEVAHSSCCQSTCSAGSYKRSQRSARDSSPVAQVNRGI